MASTAVEGISIAAVLADVERERYRHVSATKAELVAAIDRLITFCNNLRRHIAFADE